MFRYLILFSLLFMASIGTSEELHVSLKNRASWVYSSVPAKQQLLFPESNLDNNLAIGYNRAKICWNSIDPLFTRNNSLTPVHLRNNVLEQNNHFTREVYINELFPDEVLVEGEPKNFPIFNISFYPSERGIYNYYVLPSEFSSGVNRDGALKNPQTRWGGIMRTILTGSLKLGDFSSLRFMLMDPFVYDKEHKGGKLFIQIGDISEDILKDNRISNEAGLPPNSDVENMDTTIWGRIGNGVSVYGLSNNPHDRVYQDIGLDGLCNKAERSFFKEYLNTIQGVFGEYSGAYQEAFNDPSSDDYHYFRGTDYDEIELGILDRYKKYNRLERNSTTDETSPEQYITAAKVSPDFEDINYNLNLDIEESYFQYEIDLSPEYLEVGKNFIDDKLIVKPENGDGSDVAWYQFILPFDSGLKKEIGQINYLMDTIGVRLILSGFSDEIHLRIPDVYLVIDDTRYIDQNYCDKSLQIMPNPSDGKFLLRSEYKPIKAIEVYDRSGIQIDKIENNVYNIDLSYLNNGFYLAVIRMMDGLICTKKILINK